MIVAYYNYIEIPLYLLLCSFIGLVVIKRNLINMLISIEIMLLALSFQAILISFIQDDVVGFVFSLFIISIAAAESAIGLAILIVFFRLRGSIFVDVTEFVKG